jgi:hypothetical protein
MDRKKKWEDRENEKELEMIRKQYLVSWGGGGGRGGARQSAGTNVYTCSTWRGGGGETAVPPPPYTHSLKHAHSLTYSHPTPLITG